MNNLFTDNTDFVFVLYILINKKKKKKLISVQYASKLRPILKLELLQTVKIFWYLLLTFKPDKLKEKGGQFVRVAYVCIYIVHI